jgi:hypothetical protein
VPLRDKSHHAFDRDWQRKEPVTRFALQTIVQKPHHKNLVEIDAVKFVATNPPKSVLRSKRSRKFL